MPELPEVEIAARNLRRWLVGRRIQAIDGPDGGPALRLVRPDPPASLAQLGGRRISSVARVGKHLLVELAGEPRLGFYSHLGMTGRWVRRLAGDAPPPHSRVRLHVDDGSVVHYADVRLFGKLRVAPEARFSSLPEIGRLGPDPLSDGIDADRLRQRLARTRRAVKVALLDQAILAGVGNIQANEALFRARLDPRRLGSSLSRAEARRLGAAISASIEDTIAADLDDPGFDPERGDFPYVEDSGAPNPFAIYGREGERCPRCGKARIEELVLGGRASYLCPACQR